MTKILLPLLGFVICSGMLAGELSGQEKKQPAEGKSQEKKQPEDKIDAVQKQLEKINDSLKQAFSDLGTINNSLTKAFGDVGKDMKKIQEDIKDLKDNKMDLQLKLASTLGKIDDLEKQMGLLQSDFQNLKQKLTKDYSLYPPVANSGMEDLKQRLQKIEKMVGDMRGSTRIALSPPSVGRIVLVNGYNEDILFIVNGTTYRLTPGSTSELDNQPSGTFTYEVVSPTFGLRARNTRTLNPNETFTISAR